MRRADNRAERVCEPAAHCGEPCFDGVRVIEIVELGKEGGLVLGRILAMHVRDEFVIDPVKHHIDTPRLGLIGRMHGVGWYVRTSDLFEMKRIPRDVWKLRDTKLESE